MFHNYNKIMNDAVVEGPGYFEHLGFFDMQSHRIEHGSPRISSHLSVAAAAGMDSCIFGSAVKFHSHQTTAAGWHFTLMQLCFMALTASTNLPGYDCERYILFANTA